MLNAFVKNNAVGSVIEFGCGDGGQLALAAYPAYTGVDVSDRALDLCRARFDCDASKCFLLLDRYDGRKADMALSLDVVYHLVEDAVFEAHMRTLFDAATRFVAVYSSDTNDNRDIQGLHIRHRKFTDWVRTNRPDWVLLCRVPNRIPYDGSGVRSSFADFYIFAKPASQNGNAETILPENAVSQT
ncbi:MAG TPA: class I SAM-dependent methyltransferase [Opitutales bacterium]|nr:class I SAM-dependent methyltransferase [Opitutales bacterium]